MNMRAASPSATKATLKLLAKFPAHEVVDQRINRAIEVTEAVRD